MSDIFGKDAKGGLGNKPGVPMAKGKLPGDLAKAARLRRVKKHDFGNQQGPDTNQGNHEFSVHINFPMAASMRRGRTM